MMKQVEVEERLGVYVK
jgi:hypothetical protein